MINWNPLSLSHKSLIDEYLDRFPIKLSDYAFTNLWMWDGVRHYEWTILDEALCIRFGHTYLFPLGKLPPIAKLIKDDPQFSMRAIPEESLSHFQTLNLKIAEEPDRNDYIYKFKDLLTLAGNQYQAKRNLIHQLNKAHKISFIFIDEEYLPGLIEFEENWAKQHPDAGEEHQAALRGLMFYKELDLTGGVLLADNEIIAYTYAELYNGDTWLIHVEKANLAYKGSYQAINQAFIAHVAEALWVNREEDLGIQFLVKSKSSYHPDHILKKFSANRR